jgi:hypothetical protein
MQHKRLPEPGPTIRMREYKAFSDQFGFGSMQRQHLYFGGVYDATTSLSRYYLHTLFTESANSILTIIWLTLCKHFDSVNNPPETLTITIDGKSTGMNCRCLEISLSLLGKNYLLLAFMEWVVRQLKLLKLFRIIVLSKGHSVNKQDVQNEPTANAYYSMSGTYIIILIIII